MSVFIERLDETGEMNHMEMNSKRNLQEISTANVKIVDVLILIFYRV